TLAAHTMLGVLPLRLFGSEEAKARWLGRLTTGGLAAFALTEPQGGSDIGGLETSAVRDGDDYVLTGEKALIASIHHADLIIVAARTRPEGGSMGLSVFLVDPELPGVHVHDRREATMGMRGTDIGSVSFSEVRIPSTAILGRENLGMMVLHKGLVGDRVATATIALGIAEAAQAHAVRYAKSRMQGGEPISRHQAVRNLIADMEVRIAASRLLIEAAAEKLSSGKDATEAASVAKLHASEAANAVAKDAVQIFGGWGYLRNYPVERLMRDAKHTEIVDGTSQIQRLLIADSVLRRIR
ncbi:MAG: acyl-CoA dehydrogenase family protein, partial [Gemmatimonadales bacterium]